MPGTTYQLEVNPQLPQRLARLDELANNLWYSWDRPTRTLFSRLHPFLWHAIGHSPKAFLKRIDQERLTAAADDPVFLSTYNRVLSAFDSYCDETRRSELAEGLEQDDLIAYFCAEFGFHESMPIYSGGLGILAGDHCKAASDLALPFVGVGLLYRQGYFSQTIDNEGRQHAHYADSDFDDLPIAPVLRADGTELHVTVDLRERRVIGQGLAARKSARCGWSCSIPISRRTPPPTAISRTGSTAAIAPPASSRRSAARRRRGARAGRNGPEAHGMAYQRRARRVPGARARAATRGAGP